MTSGWERKLRTMGMLRLNEPMSSHTTLGIGGPARWFIQPDTEDALGRALALIPASVAILPLGRGSNLLVPDEGIDGVVLDMSRLNAISAHTQTGENCLTAQAGVRMAKLARICAARGLSGFEFMATVPGDVGGGVAMNAGAFGQQISDSLACIDIAHRDGKCEQIRAMDLNMGYRRTQLPAGSIVLAATFQLKSSAPESIRKKMRAMRNRRTASQPLAQPNCGSVFKNPPGHHAARLIEEAGLKGQRTGRACISEQHANFIVNEGGATSSDVLDLIRRAQEVVLRQTGVRLEPEVRILEEIS